LQSLEKGAKNSPVFFQETGIDTDQAFIKYYSELKVENACRALEKEIEEKFGVETQVQMEWKSADNPQNTYSGAEIEITKILLKSMSETAQKEKENMLIYIRENYCSEVLIE
jgi:hypothetical protein